MNSPNIINNPDTKEVMAIIIRNDYMNDGIQFFTGDDYSQQMAFMSHPKGHIISPHIHNHVERQIKNTQEVLILKKGKLRVDFYNNTKKYLVSTIVEEGDIIMLVSGGHGFEVLEEVRMVEIKQGPYLGIDDKVKFVSTPENIVVELG